MTWQIEGRHAAEFMVSEGNGHISRETVTVTGGNYEAGTVLGKITVAAGSGKYTQHDPAAANGSQIAAAVLFANVDASDADKQAVAIVRMAEVNGGALEWKTGITTNEKTAAAAALAGAFIIVRS